MSDLELVQRVFDRAVNGMVAQGFEKATDGSDNCCYETETGTRCAIGHTIHDIQAIHDRALTDDPIDEVVELYPEVIVDIFGQRPADMEYALSFLRELQEAHDVAVDDVSMKTKLREVERRYGLFKHPALVWSPPK